MHVRNCIPYSGISIEMREYVYSVFNFPSRLTQLSETYVGRSNYWMIVEATTERIWRLAAGVSCFLVLTLTVANSEHYKLCQIHESEPCCHNFNIYTMSSVLEKRGHIFLCITLTNVDTVSWFSAKPQIENLFVILSHDYIVISDNLDVTGNDVIT